METELNESVTLETCIKKLNYNKHHYGNKGLNMQIYFVAQVLNMSYDKIVEKMQKPED